MERGFFVTGTDTGVGKTRAGTALAHALVSRGLLVHARKPVESGCMPTSAGLMPADAEALRVAAGGHEALETVNAIRLQAPLSPERAAALEGVHFDVRMLAAACRTGVARGGWSLVEGAGGFYSPIAPAALNADLAVALGLPVVLVAADRLGVINQVLLALEAIRARGLAVAAVVLSEPVPVVDADMDNRGELERWARAPVLRLPHGPAGQASWRVEAVAFDGWLDGWVGTRGEAPVPMSPPLG